MNTNTSNTSSHLSLTEGEAREKYAISSAFSSVGIDTVALQAPVDPEMRRQLAAQVVTNKWIRTSGPMRGVRLTFSRWNRAIVIADLPLVAGHPTNEHPVEPEFAGALARQALRAVLDLVPLTYEGSAVTTDAFAFTRVDVVRDFVDVDDFDGILDVVQRELLRAGIRFHRRSEGSSLAVERDEWRAVLYDKHAKPRSVAPPGTVRFELNLHTRTLQSKWAQELGANWRRPDDITRQSAYLAARDTFVGKARFHTAARPASQILPRIKGLASGPLQQATLLGLAHEPALLREFKRSSKTKYRRLAQEIGPVADPGHTLRYLDFESGRQLISTEEA